MTRAMTARGRGLARLVGSVGMLAWLRRNPDVWPVWLDGHRAGAETAAHRDAVWVAELAAAFEEGYRAGQRDEQASLEQDWAASVGSVVSAHARVPSHAVLSVKRGLPSVQREGAA